MSFIKDLKLSGLSKIAKDRLMEMYKEIRETYRGIPKAEPEEKILGENNGIPDIQEYFSACPFGEAVRKYPR